MTSLHARLAEKYRRDGLSATVGTGLRFVKTLLWRGARHAVYGLKSRLGDERVRLNGVTLDLSSPVVTAAIRQSILRGDYERDEAAFIEAYAESDTDVIELGAGIGFVSATIGGVLDSDRTQVAVEPNPDVIPTLRRTRELNGCSFAIEQRAYSQSDAVGIGPEAVFWSVATDADGEGQNFVEATTLRELLELYDLPEFTLVADIEGGEFELFESELDLLAARCELLVVEFHPDENHDIEPYERLLKSAGFERIDGRNDVAVYRNAGE